MTAQTTMTLLAATLLLSLLSGNSQAHGQLPNVQSYCEKLFTMDKRTITRNLDKVDYYYQKSNRQWYCRLSYPNFSTGSYKTSSRPFDPAEVCGKTRGTYKVHHHRGTDVTTLQSMHCGITDGTLSGNSGQPTTLTLCNRSHAANIYASYAYWVSGNGNKGWRAVGWYNIKQNACRTVTVGDNYDSYLYVYAEGGGSTWGGQDARFCVNANKGYDIRNADEVVCNAAPLKKVRMTKFDVKRGENTYNFN